MPDPVLRPLLFLDVDGPLIPFGAPSHPTYPTTSQLPNENPLLDRIDPAHGQRLAALRCELVWATSWMADANDSVSPRLGLPDLPVVIWPEASELDDQDARSGLHWKTRALVAWAAGRAFVWVDDEIGDVDRGWVAANHSGPALLQGVNSQRGISAADYAVIRSWLEEWRPLGGL